MRKQLFRFGVQVPAVMALIYLLGAYLIIPQIWVYYESKQTFIVNGGVTYTKQGIPADPLNFGLIGTQDEVVKALREAGWYPADAVTLKSSLRIAGSVVFHKPYIYAPVSPLVYQGRKQDLAFEKPSGKSAKSRHHARLWKVLDVGDDGRPVWVGAGTFDQSVGLSHLTGQITHHINPNIDDERDTLIKDLVKTQTIKILYQLRGVGPTTIGHNGGGDRYYTDGEIKFAVIAPGYVKQSAAPQVLANPPSIASANSIWSFAQSVQRGR